MRGRFVCSVEVITVFRNEKAQNKFLDIPQYIYKRQDIMLYACMHVQVYIPDRRIQPAVLVIVVHNLWL